MQANYNTTKLVFIVKTLLITYPGSKCFSTLDLYRKLETTLYTEAKYIY